MLGEEEGSHAVKVTVLHAVNPLRCAFYYKKSSSELDPHAALFQCRHSGFMDVWTHCLNVQGGFRSGSIPESRPRSAWSAGRFGGCATGAACSGPQSSGPGRPAPPGSS